MIQKLPESSLSATPPSLVDISYEQLASADELAAIAHRLASREEPVHAIVFRNGQAVALGSDVERDVIAIAQKLLDSSQATHLQGALDAAGIGLEQSEKFHSKAALVARLSRRGDATTPMSRAIEACARALSANLRARFELSAVRDRLAADRAYLAKGFLSGLKEVRLAADELRALCLNQPGAAASTGDRSDKDVARAAVALGERLRAVEGWARLAESKPAQMADTGRALQLALTRLRSAYALGEDQLRVEPPLFPVRCDEGRLATLIEEATKVLLRRETKISLSTTEQFGEVVLEMRCLEILGGEPIDAAETIPFARRISTSSPDLSLALVEQIARSASGRVLLGPGHCLRVILPALPESRNPAEERQAGRTT